MDSGDELRPKFMEFPYVSGPHRNLMVELVSTVETGIGSSLQPCTLPPEVQHFGNPTATSHASLLIRSGLPSSQETLVDLLGMAGRRPWLPMVVCCSTRDELDAVCSNLSNLSSYINNSSLYSDLSEVERAQVLDNFRRATGRWNRMGRDEIDAEEEKEEERKSHVIVVTDACLPLVGSGESPVSARILINYELPTKKETYMRRMATCLSADGIVINMVVGGEVVILKSIEENSGLVIAEMPIHIFEMM